MFRISRPTRLRIFPFIRGPLMPWIFPLLVCSSLFSLLGLLTLNMPQALRLSLYESGQPFAAADAVAAAGAAGAGGHEFPAAGGSSGSGSEAGAAAGSAGASAAVGVAAVSTIAAEGAAVTVGGASGPSTALLFSAAIAAAAACFAAAVLWNPLLRRQLRVFTMAACVFVDYRLTKELLSRSARKKLLARQRRRQQRRAAAAVQQQPQQQLPQQQAEQQSLQKEESQHLTGSEPGAAAAAAAVATAAGAAAAATSSVDWEEQAEEAEALKEEQREADVVWERVHERNAQRIFSAIVALEGLWVKAGQYLSTRADVIPEPYLRRFRLLQDTLPPRDLEKVYAEVERALGQHPKDMFLSFDPTPLATASIAQVHRARTVDDEEVVVKVQHRGIKDRILQDLSNLRTIVEWVAWAEPDYNFSPVVEEWAKEVPKELDFRVEAENMKEVTRNLCGDEEAAMGGEEGGGGGGDVELVGKKSARDEFAVHVLLPTVRIATEKVLVMQFMDGARLNDDVALDRLGVDRQKLVEDITKAYAHQIYVDGLFNADPHPGNFLVSKELPHRPILLDFGLCKRIDMRMRQALARMLLAAAEGDVTMLLSSFSEMGLHLRTDMPDDAMAVTAYFFRRAAPRQEALADMKVHAEQMRERMEQRREKAKQEGQDETSLRRNPVDAFPGELVFFTRVLNLLRGLSTTLGARVAYMDLMKPFAQHVLSLSQAALTRSAWFRAPRLVEPLTTKLEQLLWELQQEGKVVGMQVCAYKDGRVVVDVAAGVMGKYDPRPVEQHTLFPVFSATKGVTAALVHWLALEQRLLDFHAPVSSIWPEFAANGKEECTVAHILTHRAGLEMAFADDFIKHPLMLCQWEDMKRRIAAEQPQSKPGEKEAYHYLTFGWLAGGIVEAAARKPFQQVLEEALVEPLGVQGEFYIGIPPGVESRLATLSLSPTQPSKLPSILAGVPGGAAAMSAARATAAAAAATAATTIQTSNGAAGSQWDQKAGSNAPGDKQEEMAGSGEQQGPTPVGGLAMQAGAAAATAPAVATTAAAAPVTAAASGGSSNVASSLTSVFNALFVRRAIIPSANGHFSARALARMYAALAAHGTVPPVLSSSEPPLGSCAPAKPAPVAGGSERKEGGMVASGSLGTVMAVGRVAWRTVALVGWGLGRLGGWWLAGASRRLNMDVVLRALGQPVVKEKSEGENLLPRVCEGNSGEGAVPEGERWSMRGEREEDVLEGRQEVESSGPRPMRKIFSHPEALDAFVGGGSFSHLALPESSFGLGFVRYKHTTAETGGKQNHHHQQQQQQQQQDPPHGQQHQQEHQQQQQEQQQQSRHLSSGSSISPSDSSSSSHQNSTASDSPSRRWCAFGHAGLGGSVAFADPEHDFAIAILVNQLSFERETVSRIVRLICTELDVPIPAQFQDRTKLSAETAADAAPSADTMIAAAPSAAGVPSPDTMNAEPITTAPYNKERRGL